MSAKPVRPRYAALRDTEQAVVHYSRVAGLDVAERFIEGLEAIYPLIGERPGRGSPRHGHELGFPGLRSQGMRRFPYLIFYREHREHIEILRILHARSNIDEALFDGMA